MIQTLWRIAYEAGYGYFANRLSTSAAAMAFYTMFALGPIMIFTIAIAEPFVGRFMAQEAIFDALGTVVAQDQLRTIRRFRQARASPTAALRSLLEGGVMRPIKRPTTARFLQLIKQHLLRALDELEGIHGGEAPAQPTLLILQINVNTSPKLA